jgi:methyltransferase (TIGR00027 family)
MAESAATTAYGVMAQIALEQARPKARRIFEDPLAVHMLSPSQQAMTMFISMRPLRQPLYGLLEKVAPGIANGILSRKRYIDDKLSESLRSGINTVVILGSGLDTLAYRNSQLMNAHVYEVDLPEIITYKEKKVRQIFQTLPEHVTYVPIDFETQSLDTVLISQGWSPARHAFYVWEGVTQYLTEAGVRGTFEFLAKASAGSRLVFTYVVKDFIDGVNKYGLDSFYQRVRVKNQLWHFGLNPPDVEKFMGKYGWKVLEQAGADEFRKRYVEPAGRSEPVSEIERTVYAKRVT